MRARVVGYIGVAVAPLDEDELIRLLDDIVFILEQDDIAVCCNNIRQLIRRAERAGIIRVDDVLGLLPSEFRIEMGEVDIH